MVQDTISSAILIIAVVIATAAVVNAVYPAMFSSMGSVRSTAEDASSRSGTCVTIASHAFEDGYSTLRLWAKNGGEEKIAGSDLSNARIYYGSDTGPLSHYDLTYAIQEPGDGDADWDPGETLEMSISSAPVPHEPGLHRVRLALPNGAISEYTFTI